MSEGDPTTTQRKVKYPKGEQHELLARSALVFACGLHPRLGCESPLLDNVSTFLLRDIFNLAYPSYPFYWNPEMKGSAIHISEGGIRITGASSTSRVIANISYETGIHRWGYRILSIESDYLGVGIMSIPKSQQVDMYVYMFDSLCLGWIINEINCCGSKSAPTEKIEAGDTIEVELDCDNRTLYFIKNNGQYTTQKFHITLSPPYYPAACTQLKGDCLEILSNSLIC